MLMREDLLGPIRDMAEQLLDAGRFAIYQDIFGEVDRFNFTGVDTPTLRVIYLVSKDTMAFWDLCKRANRPVCDWTAAYLTYGDSIVQHSGEFPVIADAFNDWLASLTAYLLENPEDVAIVAKHWPHPLCRQRIKFFAGLKYREDKTQYYSSSLQKVSSAESKRNDKRWDVVPSYADGSLSAIAALAQVGSGGILAAYSAWTQIHAYLEEEQGGAWHVSIGEKMKLQGVHLDRAFRALNDLVTAHKLRSGVDSWLESWKAGQPKKEVAETRIPETVAGN